MNKSVLLTSAQIMGLVYLLITSRKPVE